MPSVARGAVIHRLSPIVDNPAHRAGRRGRPGPDTKGGKSTMQLVSIRDDEITVELNWGDVALLLHVGEHAKQHDVMGQAHDWGMAIGYLEATVAFLQAAGMASWARTVGDESYILERFRELVPITAAERRADK